MSTTNTNMNLTIDDGFERITIKNKYGEDVGVFRFCPTDVSMIDRYNEVARRFSEVTDILDKNAEPVDAAADETAEEVDNGFELSAGAKRTMNTLAAAKAKLFELFDYLFDGNMSEAFFGKTNPFTPIGGKFYCESALELVGGFISQRLGKEVEKLNARTAKYTNGYAPHGVRTGKHKNGGK